MVSGERSCSGGSWDQFHGRGVREPVEYSGSGDTASTNEQLGEGSKLIGGTITMDGDEGDVGRQWRQKGQGCRNGMGEERCGSFAGKIRNGIVEFAMDRAANPVMSWGGTGVVYYSTDLVHVSWKG